MKKILLLTLTCILCFSACEKENIPSNGDLYGNNPDAFVTIWKSDNEGISEDNQIEIPGSGHQYTVFWEEIGNPENNRREIATDIHTVTFPKEGMYKVSIFNTSNYPFNRISLFDPESKRDNKKLISIEQWGNIEWVSFENAFKNCENLEINATDAPNLKNVENMNSMFFRIKNVNESISNWDVSNVTDMSAMFFHCYNFNQDISDWDVSNVTDMSYSFSSCDYFNQDISNWDVSNVTDMSSMFWGCDNFNQDISNWNVSNVIDMSSIFNHAFSFNQDISNWDVSNVTDMRGMFSGFSKFNQDISSWDVSNVTKMSFMFSHAISFSQDISNWDVSNVTDMVYMFRSTGSFNQDITNWNVSNVSQCRFFATGSNLDTINLPNFPAGCN
ncbi:MAG: surface protein [Polaribacter sp.]|jgi:surface protein